MKKRILLTLLILMVIGFGASYAFAQGVPEDTPTAAFVDADGDGVCDNRGSGLAGNAHQNNGG